MSDLADWLSNCIEEDELAATAAIVAHARWRRQYELDIQDDEGERIATATATTVADHIARHSPEHVLADCKAKQELIAEHVGGHECWRGGGYWHDAESCDTLRTFASVYADRPGWREEWRP